MLGSLTECNMILLQVGDTPSNTTELLSNYFSEPRNLVNEALKMIKTVRLRKFKGSRVEMCLVRLLLAHSLNLEKMIIEQYSRNATRCNEHLKELVSFPRASPKAVLKYLESPSHETRKRAAPVQILAYYDFLVRCIDVLFKLNVIQLNMDVIWQTLSLTNRASAFFFLAVNSALCIDLLSHFVMILLNVSK